jgi:hypothetical protein
VNEFQMRVVGELPPHGHAKRRNPTARRAKHSRVARRVVAFARAAGGEWCAVACYPTQATASSVSGRWKLADPELVTALLTTVRRNPDGPGYVVYARWVGHVHPPATPGI